ncbi:hypothetical protein L484_025122 [Morus notabilis]|uniref:Uncharacterized protein n=1 Tax=Morus notabilis TaxID=981085 RepID=W9RAM9_9ROSA|nr:hypothetical protein L484_025122 [Morus notabilis]
MANRPKQPLRQCRVQIAPLATQPLWTFAVKTSTTQLQRRTPGVDPSISGDFSDKGGEPSYDEVSELGNAHGGGARVKPSILCPIYLVESNF